MARDGLDLVAVTADHDGWPDSFAAVFGSTVQGSAVFVLEALDGVITVSRYNSGESGGLQARFGYKGLGSGFHGRDGDFS